MNERELARLMQSLEPDLMDKELREEMKELEIDMESIAKKSRQKLADAQGQPEKKRRRWSRTIAAAAASLVVVAGVGTVYAEEISDFMKSFLGQNTVYSTVRTGAAYYLDAPVSLGGDYRLEKAIFAENSLRIHVTIPKGGERPNTVNVGGKTYEAGGYAIDEDGTLLDLSFYDIPPQQQIEVMVDGEGYLVTLSAGDAVVSGGEILPSEGTAPAFVELGYRMTDKGLQILPAFTDPELRLISIGELETPDAQSRFENRKDDIISSSTGSGAKPLTATGGDGKSYTFTADPNSETPRVLFTSDLPAGQSATLKVPGLVAGYRENMGTFSTTIPANGQRKELSQEIDLGLQKMTLDTITRTSDTTAVLAFTLNTGDEESVRIHEADLFSQDVTSANTSWELEAGRCTMEITFDAGLESADFSVGYPYFYIEGNWELAIQ